MKQNFMNLSIDGINLEVTSILRLYIQKKIAGLEKFIKGLDARVELDRDPHHHTGLVFHAAVNLIVNGKTMRAEVRSDDAYTAIDLLIPKLKEQIDKFRGKQTTSRRRKSRKIRKKQVEI